MFSVPRFSARRSARCFAAALSMVLLGLSVHSTRATNVYWDTNGASTGATNGTTASGTWDNNTTANWTTNSAGTSATTTYNTADGGSPLTADVFFSAGTNATGASTVTVSGTIQTHSITFEEGAVTLTGGTLQIANGGSIDVLSTNTQSQTVATDLQLGSDGTSATSFTFTNDSTTAGQLLTISGAVNETHSNGNNPARTINLTGSGNGLISGVIEGNGATNGNNSRPLVTVAKSGAGTWTLSGANTYAGGTTVSAGALFVNNTSGSGTGTGAVSVTGSGTTLGGSGSISGAVTVASGNNLAPGASGVGSVAQLDTGALTLASTSNFRVDITGAGGVSNAGTTYDQANVTGTVGITGSNLVLNVSGLTSSNINQNFFILANDSTDAITGTFAQGATITSGGDTFTISYVANTSSGSTTGGNDIALTLTAVPEPSTWVAAGLALLFIGYTQRRKLVPALKSFRRQSCRVNC